MDNYKKIKEKILNMVEQLKNKNILVEVDFHENRNKFSVYSTRYANSLNYKVIYIPKKFLLKEDEYYINKFPSFLSSLDSKATKIDYLLKDLDKNSKVNFENVKYNSYFHFTENEVIVNIDSYGDDLDKFKEILMYYNKNPKIFVRNIVSNNLSYDFNELVKNGKMRYFKSNIYNVKLQGKKYIVFNTTDSFEKIMYILDEEDNYMDIMDEKYIKILKKLSLINGL